MAQFKPYKIARSKLDSLPIKEGQFICFIDSDEMFLDVTDSKRISLLSSNVKNISAEGSNLVITKGDGSSTSIPISEMNDGIPTSEKGVANGVAGLDENGRVPAVQLPSYVDDVIEGYYSPEDGKFYYLSSLSGSTIDEETGKIYIDLSTQKTYRWSGSAFAVISETLALGTTASTAFRGDHGNVAYQHAVEKGSAFTSGLYKITTNDQGHVIAASAVTKADITALGVPGQDTNTTYSVATTSADGLMSSTDKIKLNGLAVNKYLALSISTGDWTGNGPYAYTLANSAITENSFCVFNFTEESYKKISAPISWTTSAGKVVLSTTVKPASTIIGHIALMQHA